MYFDRRPTHPPNKYFKFPRFFTLVFHWLQNRYLDNWVRFISVTGARGLGSYTVTPPMLSERRKKKDNTKTISNKTPKSFLFEFSNFISKSSTYKARINSFDPSVKVGKSVYRGAGICRYLTRK